MPVERELKGGESHIYRIKAEKGQFLRVTLEERGIDLVLLLMGPDGKTIVEADSLNYRYGIEPASLIADSMGTYQARVEAREAMEPVGNYKIELTDRRPPKPEDQKRIAAERTLFKAKSLAGKLGTHSNASEAREAITKYEKALELWREVGDRFEVGLCLYSAAFLYDRLGEKRKALALYNEALPLCHASGDQVGEATTLNNMGLVYYSLGEYQNALESFQKVLPFERAAQARNEEATTLGNIAVIYDALGEKQKALQTYNQVLPVKRETGDRDGETITLLQMGTLYFTLGDYPGARENCEQALALSRAIGNRVVEYAALNSLGAIYTNLQEIQKAVDYYSQALQFSSKAGDRVGQSTTINNIGLLVFETGDKEKALQLFQKALTIERAVGDSSGEATTLSNVGYIYALLGKKQEALDSNIRALTLARTLRNPILEAEINVGLMYYWEKESNPSLAVFFGKQAVNSIQQVRRNITGLEQKEQQSFIKSNEGIYREVADLLVSQGRLYEAEQLLGMLKEEEYLKFTRSARPASASESVALTKTEADAQKRCFEVTSALTAMAEEFDRLSVEPTRTAAEEKRYEELRGRINDGNDALQQFFHEVYVEFGNSHTADLEKRNLEGNSTSMETTLGSLGPGTVAIYTVVAPERVSMLVVTPNARVARQYPVSDKALRKKVFAFWKQLRTGDGDPLPLAQELYQILIGPIQKDLDAYHATTLMWSLDDVLRYIPMSALHDGKQYMVEKYRNEVFTQKSIGTLAGEQTKSSLQVLGMGVSKAHGELPELPAVGDELRGIVRSEGTSPGGLLPGRLLLDDAFTEERMVKSLELRFAVVHIASHFAFRAGDEENSFLLIGGNGNGTGETNDRLSLRQIRIDQAIRFRNTELLTLSACDTATSGSSNGEEVDGLADIVQEKGAKAVLASLWEVDDASTGLLMKKFYEFWTRQPATPKVEALRLAQIALLQGKVTVADSAPGRPKDQARASYANPHFWAPFVLFGNWK